ncbi:TGS domain-containing protein [Chloroflexota bacterium]
MPANLPPKYHEAERRYREAKDPDEKIEALEEMLAIMPKHKGTDHLRADLRARMAKLTADAQKKSGRRGNIYNVRKEGAGQVALVGLTNSGKSSLVAIMTHANPDIGDWAYTTKMPLPGMMEYENINIQLLDLPAVDDHSAYMWMPGALRRADYLMIVVDLSRDPLIQMRDITDNMEKLRTGIASRPSEWGVKQAIVVGSKGDHPRARANYDSLKRKYSNKFAIVSTSTEDMSGLEDLRQLVFDALGIIRVYTKAPGQQAALNKPVTLKKGSTVQDAASQLHKDFARELKYTVIWGSGKYNNQRVKRDHVLADGDIVEFHT